MTRHAAPRRGFTLIELLVVILIIAILVSLTVVVIGKVRVRAKVAATAADMAQIASAIGTYKSKMNVQYIPSCGGGTNGTFRLRRQYAGNEPEAVYLKSVWPQLPGCTGIATEFTGITRDSDLDANQTLVFFLTGGDQTNFQGFSTNRTNPFTTPSAGSTESRIGPFLTFPDNRYLPGSNVPGADKTRPALLDLFGAPYAYFAFNPMVNTYKFPVHDTKSNTYSYTGDQGYVFNGTTVTPYIVNSKYLEPKGFQIISAGDNGKDETSGSHGFGAGGTLWLTSDQYDEGNFDQKAFPNRGNGWDDLANFNGGSVLASKN